MYKQFKCALLPGVIASTLALTACGGGGGSNGTDPGTVNTTSSRGVITGFGSMYVNGVKYDIEDAELEFDDEPKLNDDDFRVGQVVTVTGSVDDNGTTGTATSISYENELQGPISNKSPDGTNPLIGTMDILGVQITVNADTRFEGNLTFESFADGDYAEISGFTTADGITATYIEKEDNSEVEIVGVIAELDEVATTFTVRGFPVDYDITDPDDGLVLDNGVYVEVKGALDITQTTIVATNIEAEDDGRGEDNDDAEVQGVVSNFDSDTNTFDLGIIKVDASNAVLIPATLDLGSTPAPEVEAEGHWLNGVLIADEVKLKGQKIKIEALTSAVDATAGTVTFTFNDKDIVVLVDNKQTEMEDDAGSTPLEVLTLADLASGGGDFVEIEAYSDDSKVINAIELERADPDVVIIQGPVETFDEGTQEVKLLGVTFNLTGVVYKDDEITIDLAAFYGALDAGVFIKIKDTTDGGDGAFEEAELEDD